MVIVLAIVCLLLWAANLSILRRLKDIDRKNQRRDLDLAEAEANLRHLLRSYDFNKFASAGVPISTKVNRVEDRLTKIEIGLEAMLLAYKGPDNV